MIFFDVINLHSTFTLFSYILIFFSLLTTATTGVLFSIENFVAN